MKAHDRIIGICSLCVCIGLFINTFTFRKTEWEQLSMAFWPRLILLLIAILSVYFILRGRVSLDETIEPVLKKAFFTAAAGFLYVFLLEPVGFLLITPVFIFLFSILISQRRLPWRVVESGITAVLGTAIIYTVFVLGLKLMLPAGLLEL